ncbi:hypothetical protein ABZ726_09115 [Streptomyces hundungensis]|uniref:hypothetical protein n=1 Tax=Streptomyces hundungensis TaxID=1077946 RepID=UPI0033D155BA
MRDVTSVTGEQGVYWDELATRHWGRRPGRFTVPAPLSAARAHELVVKATEPFRAGTVYGALPKVRLHTSRGWLGAPGRLLPGAGDTSAERYLARAERELALPGLLLSVHRPLHLDYALWAAVRDALAGLWRTVGWPCLPVEAELTEARGFTWDRGMGVPSEHAVLLWVLEGNLEVTLWPGAEGEPIELAASAGELLYWPDGYRSQERHAERCVTLRVHVPRAPRLATAAGGGARPHRCRRPWPGDPGVRSAAPGRRNPLPEVPRRHALAEHRTAWPRWRYRGHGHAPGRLSAGRLGAGRLSAVRPQ